MIKSGVPWKRQQILIFEKSIIAPDSINYCAADSEKIIENHLRVAVNWQGIWRPMYVSFYSTVYYNFLGCIWKSACQHGEKKGPEWGIYRVLDLHHLDPGMVFATHSWAWNNWPLSLEGNNRFLLCLWHLGTQNFTSVSHSTNPAQDRFWSLRPKRLLSSGSSMLV